MRCEAKLLDTEFKRQIESFRRKLSSALLSLPENPNINCLSANCAAVPSSQLLNLRVGKHKNAPKAPWSPEYHLFHKTHKEIAKQIENATPHTIRRVIVGIIKYGHYRKKSGRIAQVHPDVVQQIKTLWNSN